MQGSEAVGTSSRALQALAAAANSVCQASENATRTADVLRHKQHAVSDMKAFADGNIGRISTVADICSENPMTSSAQSGFGNQTGDLPPPTFTDTDTGAAPQEKAMQALSSGEEAVALAMFSAARFQAYHLHLSAEASDNELDHTNCMGPVGSPSDSSRHSVSCAGMVGQGITAEDATSHGGCDGAWECDNAWMDEYRRGAVSRCVSRSRRKLCSLVMYAETL